MKQSTLRLVSSVLVTIALLLWGGCGKDEAEKTNSEGANSTSDDANSHSKYKEELAKIKSLGEPTTLADLNTWHKAVPAEKGGGDGPCGGCVEALAPDHDPVDFATIKMRHGNDITVIIRLILFITKAFQHCIVILKSRHVPNPSTNSI